MFSNQEVNKTNKENSSHQLHRELGFAVLPTQPRVGKGSGKTDRKGTSSNEAAQTNDGNRPTHEQLACPFPVPYNFLPTIISFLQGISPPIRRQQQQQVKLIFPSQVINNDWPH